MGTTTCRIIRQSTFSFLKNYQYFTSTPALVAFPFALSSLLSHSLITSSYLFPLLRLRLTSLFLAAGFPPSSQLFAILNLKLSQTILTFLFVSPFTYSFLLLAKASVIQAHRKKPPHEPEFSSWIALFRPLLITQLCNSLLILSANATCFFLLVIFFNCFYVLGLSSQTHLLLISATGALIYSIVLANAYVVSNLALVSSGMEKRGGFISILKACVLIQGRTATALSLAVPMNMALAAIEVLFQYRVAGAYYSRATAPNLAMLLEGMLVAYLYALLLVLDTIVNCVFWRSCKTEQVVNQEERYSHMIEIQERDGKSFAKPKPLHDMMLP